MQKCACIAVGFMLGRITIKGVSLGDAGVFIIALVVGCLFYGQLSSQLTVTHTTTVDYPSEHAEFVAYYEKHAGVKLTEEELKSITILDPNASAEEKKIAEDSIPTGETILDAPLHDTGSKWYGIASFFLPPIGLIAGWIFKKKNYIRNFKMCRKGAIAGLCTLGALIAVFGLALLRAVL